MQARSGRPTLVSISAPIQNCLHCLQAVENKVALLQWVRSCICNGTLVSGSEIAMFRPGKKVPLMTRWPSGQGLLSHVLVTIDDRGRTAGTL
jgi:hypothetical protein